MTRRAAFLISSALVGLALAASSAHPVLLAQDASRPASPAPGRAPRVLDLSLAPTPPMGWNSWNKFGCDITERLIREVADAMVATGLKDAGYQYVNLDDCWHGKRDADGMIQPDPERFPSGLAALAEYVHARGLKIGIYSDAGTMTCAKRPGSGDFEEKDATQYARWGFDYLKYDWCNTEGRDARPSYERMRDALVATGRPIVFSICEWGSNDPWLWGKGVGHLWRTTGDIGICWEKGGCKQDWELGVMNILDLQVGLERYAGPGHWNDPDMLQVGNGLTEAEDRAHFSMWAMLAAPLLAGNDLRSMSDATRAILTNREVIAIDQDPLGEQARKLRDDGNEEVWVRRLKGGRYAIAFLNRGAGPVRMSVTWKELGWAPARKVTFRDVWAHKDLAPVTDVFTARVAPHDVVVVATR
jgi:alpha-galactosidase